MRAVLVCLLLSAVTISADLQADVEDVASHLPMQNIISIGRKYVATNPSYAEGLRYVDKVTYKQLVKNFFETKEGQEFIDYFKHRDIDIETIWLFITEKVTDINKKWLEPMQEEDKQGPVITGNIMADYKKAIVASDFIEAVNKKMKSSPEFANLVAAFKDPEFRFRFYRSVNSKGLYRLGENSAEVRGFWIDLFKAVVAVGHAIIAISALFG